MENYKEIKEKKVAFKLKTSPGKKIFVAGSFNDWDPSGLRLKCRNGIYSASMKLPSGRYEYKFVVDGDWQADPECRDWVANEHGTLNSVVMV